VGRHSASAPRGPAEPVVPGAAAVPASPEKPDIGALFGLGQSEPPRPIHAWPKPIEAWPRPIEASPKVEPFPVAAPEASLPPMLPGALGAVRVPAVSASRLDEVVPVGTVLRPESRVHRGRGRRSKALAAIVVLAMIGTAITLLVPHKSTPRKHAAAVVVKRTQRTLLMTVGTTPDTAFGVLLAEDQHASTASITLLPSRLLVNVAGRGTMPLGRAFANPDSTVAAGTIADTLGVLVDNTWQLPSSAFVAMVDQLGGVTVDVDTQVIVNGQIVVNAGPGQRLTGENALAYVSALTPDQDESVRLGHLRAVLRGVLSALPAQATARTTLLGSLGASSASSLLPPALGDFLQGLGTDPDGEILPVLTLDSGGATTSYRTDPAATKDYVARVLAASIPDTKGLPAVRVFVFNGTGTPNLGARIRPKLVNTGLNLVGSQNASTFDRTESLVVIKDSNPASRAAGKRVATALGLPQSALRVDPQSTEVADVFVEVGSDLKL
jgi:hypothetical protein